MEYLPNLQNLVQKYNLRIEQKSIKIGNKIVKVCKMLQIVGFMCVQAFPDKILAESQQNQGMCKIQTFRK